MINNGLSLRLGLDLLLWAIFILFITLSVTALIKWRSIRRQLRKATIVLELTPPPAPHNNLQATEEFFAVLGHVLSLRTWRDLVNGRKSTLSLEVVSTKHEGVRYIIRLPRHDQPVFLHNLAAFAPTVSAREVLDYITPVQADHVERLLDLHQTGPKNYAIKHSHTESNHDPIAYIVNAINELADDELIALQLVVSPTTETVRTQDQQPNSGTSNAASDLVTATIHKRSQLQFQSSLRVLIRTTSNERFEQRFKGIRGALTAYSYEGYQSLQPRFDAFGWYQRYWRFAFYNRLPALFSRNGCLLASSELAALYHFPYGSAVQTVDLQVASQMILPVPLTVKNHRYEFDLQLGENTYRGRTSVIGLTEAERERHTYIVGGTGNGKSTLIEYAIIQDMQAGKGVAVIDPHGDLAENLLQYVPEERINDVVYFNPSDIRFPIGLNLLELTPGLDDDELLLEKDLVTESIVSMFRKIFSNNETTGHRIEYILRNAVQTALTLEEPTLFTVYDLLNDASFRKRVVGKLDNEDLKLFWREYARAGSYQQVSMSAGVTAKIGRFLFSASARRILEQPHSSINFDELMGQGKILICNVSKGLLGEDTSELFGITILAKIQLATLKRATRSKADRRPFYVYVDEFQNFATLSFTQLLSEARKYGLFLTIAEQSTSQQSDRRLIDVVLANVGTVIAFRTSSPLDDTLLMPLMSPQVEPGALNRLPAFNFYIRIAAEKTTQPFSGRTVLIDQPGDPMLAKLVIQASRMQYAKSMETPETKPVKQAPKRPVLGVQVLNGGSG